MGVLVGTRVGVLVGIEVAVGGSSVLVGGAASAAGACGPLHAVIRKINMTGNTITELRSQLNTDIGFLVDILYSPFLSPIVVSMEGLHQDRYLSS